MTSKDVLVSTIKDWIYNDDKIKNLQKEIKSHRDAKKKLTDSLVEIMKNNDVDCFDINNGKILFCKNKVKSPLNKTSLLSTLELYFKNNNDIDPREVSQFILENREIIIKENIRRK